MSPNAGHPIPVPPVPRTRKRKSPPQPRSGVISARQVAPAEASRPVPAVPAVPAPKPVRKRTNVADLVKRIQDMEDALAQVVCDHEARLDALEAKMTGLIQRVHASTDSVTLDDMTGVCRRLDALEAAGEVTRVMAKAHPVLVQAKAPAAPLESHKPKEQTMSQSSKETAVPSAVKAYANHLIWAAVIIASLLIWAVASNRGGLEPKYVTAKLAASGMLMGQAEDGTWAIIGQIDRGSARVAAFARGYDLGESEGRYAGYDSAVKHIHDSLSRLPKPRKATMADFETDAERTRRLDSAAKAAKDPLGIL